MCFKVLEELDLGSADDFVDFMNLIKLINAIEKWVFGNHFKKNTTVPPNIHFIIVKAISHEALWRPIPPGGDIFG